MNRRFCLPSKLLSVIFFAFILAACGGGGGGGGGSEPSFGGGSGDSGGGGGATDDSSDAAVVLSVDLIRDAVSVDSVTSVNPAEIAVSVVDTKGKGISGVIVSASTSIGEIVPPSGTALTDANGEASFTLEAGTDLGAGTVTVSVDTYNASVNFQVGESNLKVGSFNGATFVEGQLSLGSSSLPAAGSTPVTVTVVDEDDELISNAVVVNFTSGCAATSPATANITESVTTQNGVATATYIADGCVGSDTVTATIVQGNSQQATATLSVAAADVNSIAFQSASPETLALAGTGGAGRSESSTVEFQVLDETGSPAAGVEVEFTLSTRVGDLKLTNEELDASDGVIKAIATTNDLGVARAIVLAGNVSTVVRVNASITVDGETLTTVSDKLVISTGLPDQDSISLVATLLNIAGGNLDGEQTVLTVRMADKFNNPVPNGTVAFFTTEFASIEPSCETLDGGCTVTLTSQEPRQQLFNTGFIKNTNDDACPTHGANEPCPVSLGNIFGGRSTILVTAIGEESFIDANGNGIYDDGELFEDLGEAFLDHNEDGVYNPAGVACTPSANADCASGAEETFVDFNSNGVYDSGNGVYNGSLCPVDSPASVCSRELVNVRRDLAVVISSHLQNLYFVNDTGGGQTIDAAASPTGTVFIADRFNNQPAAGATITVSAEGCELASLSSFTVPNSNGYNAYSLDVTVSEITDNTDPINGSITVQVNLPSGDAPPPLIISCSDPV